MKKYVALFITILPFWLFTESQFSAKAQNTDIFVETDLQTLDYFAQTYGQKSSTYLDFLLKKSLEYADTCSCYIKYYNTFASTIVNNDGNIRDLYGINSLTYRQFMISLVRFLVCGKNLDPNYELYSNKIVASLLNLKSYLKKAPKNKEEFFNILKTMYLCEEDTAMALQYANKRLKLAKKGITTNPTNYAYALRDQFILTSSKGNLKKLESLIKEIKSIELSEFDKDLIWSSLLLDLNINMPDDIWETLLSYYIENDRGINLLIPQFVKLISANRIELINSLDEKFLQYIKTKECVELYQSIGNYSGINDNWDAALKYHLKSIRLADEIQQNDLNFSYINGKILNSWHRVFLAYAQLGDYKNQILSLEKAITALEDVCGRQSNEWIETKELLASIYSNHGDHKSSIKHTEEALQEAKQLYGKDDKNTKSIAYSLLGSYKSAYRFDDAIDLGFRLLKFEKDNQSRANLFNQLALAYDGLNCNDSALMYFDKAIICADNETDKWKFMKNKACILRDKGLIKEGIAILENLLITMPDNATDWDKVSIYDALGLSYSNIDIDKALKYYFEAEKSILYVSPKLQIAHYQMQSHVRKNRVERLNDINKAFNIYHKSNYQDSILLGILLRDKADIYSEAMNYYEAEKLYCQSLECFKILPPDNETLLTTLNNLALNYSQMGNNSGTIKILKLVCNIREHSLGKSHSLYKLSLANLIDTSISANQLDIAQEALSKYESTLLEEHSSDDDYGYNILSAFYNRKIGDVKMATKYLAKAQQYAKSDEQIQRIRAEQTQIYLHCGDIENYTKNKIQETQRIKRDIIKEYHQLSSLERNRQTFYNQNIFNDLMESALLNDDLLSNAFRFSLFSKGLLYHTSVEISKLLGDNKKANDQWNNICVLRDVLNAAIARGDSMMVSSLQDTIGQKERNLTNKFIPLKQLQNKLNISLEDVLQGIGKQGLAIDFVKYAIKDTTYYGAFLFSAPLKRPIFIEICKSSELISKAQQPNGSINYKFYRDKLVKGLTYNLIWGKLIPYFDQHEDIYFSGCGILNQLGIEYLPDKNDIPICEKYKIHRVFHLADIGKFYKLGPEIIVIGVSDYNSPIGSSISIERGGWSDLNGVNAEIEIIREQINRYTTKYDTYFIINDKAREPFIKALNNSPVSVLHIATHGFYKDKKMLYDAATNVNNIDHYVASRSLSVNNESLSGLVLRGGNLSWKSPTIDEANDDILTSSEIENLSFPQLGLTVLSACETGLGDIDSEGVWGLQRAFRIAGTQSLICSLCKIDDKWTSRFMEVFYKHAAAGESIHESFHVARKYLYDKKRNQAKIWTSLILIE